MSAETGYDAIVCGGSFGGLAAASQIGGRVLVIDSQPIGDGETSASAVPLRCLENLDLLDCVQQVHREIVIHTKRHSQRLRFFDFATFDYRRLCEDLFARTGADFLQARITGAGAGVVRTTRGTFEAPIIIEAAGWRTSAPKGRAARRARAPRKSFGVEARQPFRGEGLHFYVGPNHGSRRFYWIFPAGDHVRAGLATYTGHSSLSQDLVEFLERHDLGAPGHQHGGFFTSRMIEPIRDGMFVVGDAAGHCLPVSGEGIRPALVFGQLAGRLAERVRTGELTLDQALSHYRAYLQSRRRGYRFLDRLQSVLNVLPDPLFSLFARVIASRRVLPWAVDRYWRVADPDLLTAVPSRDPVPPAVGAG
ncbi:MAG: NAD(P)/FAD-dependent oxidoreductase [Thermoleophilia bacterium]